LLVVAGALLPSCIIRPESPKLRRQGFDRSSLRPEIILDSAPASLQQSAVGWEEGITLLGFQSEPARPKPGDTVQIDLIFRSQQEPLSDWRVFVHLEPQEVNGERINADHDPAQGRYPSSVWQENELIRDRFTVTIPSYLQTPAIEVWMGFYRGGTRLTLLPKAGIRSDGQNRALVGLIPVAGR